MSSAATAVCKNVLEITLEMLKKMGVEGLLLDVDNTLTTHNNAVPAPGVVEWLKKMSDSGIKLMLISNNTFERVAPFAEALGVGFIANGKKPLPGGMKQASLQMGVPLQRLAVVGDQFYTDILGGMWAGIKTIYVFPMEPEKGLFFKVKRLLERPFVPASPAIETDEQKGK